MFAAQVQTFHHFAAGSSKAGTKTRTVEVQNTMRSTGRLAPVTPVSVLSNLAKHERVRIHIINIDSFTVYRRNDFVSFDFLQCADTVHGIEKGLPLCIQWSG
jgi:hypothetical protein